MDSIPAALIDIYGQGPSHPQPSIVALQDTLQAIIEEFKSVYIIVDALDECVDRRKLLNWVKHISSWRSGKLHALFFSRQECDIEDEFASIACVDHVRFLGGSGNPDILKYIEEMLYETKKWAPETRIMVKDILLSGADGRYLIIKQCFSNRLI